jgi:hypothetical protein
MNNTSRISKFRAYLPSVLLLVLAMVCAHQWWTTSVELSSAQEATVDLAGTVTLDSLPLQSGVFQLTRADGQSISVPITNGTFNLASIPAGEWQQCIVGPGVPSLYQDLGTTTIDSSSRSLRFGLKGTEQLKLHVLSLLERAGE